MPSRDVVLRTFSCDAIERMAAAFNELHPIVGLVDDAARGIQFPDAVGLAIAPMMMELAASQLPPRRTIDVDLRQVVVVQRAHLARRARHDVNAHRYMQSTINQVLSYIQQNLPGTLREADVAELAGMSVSTFTRFFRRHTGCTFVQYLNRLRINEACELLMCSTLSVTDILLSRRL